MKRVVLIFALLVCILSCTTKSDTSVSCVYNFEAFQKNYDTSRYESRLTDKMWTEVLDKDNDYGEKGLYQFDEKKNLRTYAFLLDSENGAYYMVQYDSLGQEVMHPKSEVVRWFAKPHGKDSMRLSFYLNAIQYNYNNVQLRYADTLISIPQLEESERFTNLAGARLILPRLKKSSKVIVSGLKVNTCTNYQKRFIDSVFIPNEVSKIVR